jgi:hypothetical protein
MKILLGGGPTRNFSVELAEIFHNFGESKMYDFIMAYAQGNAGIAAIYLIAITLGPIVLAAYHQNTMTSWSRSTFFWLALIWAGGVGADVSGIAPWFDQGLPQIKLR